MSRCSRAQWGLSISWQSRTRLKVRDEEHVAQRRLVGTYSASLRWQGLAAEKPKVQIMPEDQVKAGMHGVAYTVFEGVAPESMDVEILGVLRNMAGPKSDVILARLHGKKVEYFGVVAGMSGSPVYIDRQTSWRYRVSYWRVFQGANRRYHSR